MVKIHGDSPGLNTPVDDEKCCTSLRERLIVLNHEQVTSKLNILNDDVQILLAAANRIRASVADVRRTSRKPISQQTNEEWLHAYDGAEVVPHVNDLGRAF